MKVLGEVIIQAKPFMQMGVDRRIFNVEKFSFTRPTATELMRNVSASMWILMVT
jgi:hypothetical protein